MCRIAGIVNFSNSLSERSRQVSSMCRSLEHGGPDDEGIWVSPDEKTVFGHRRLSLIDLSSAGHQPMAFSDRYTITYNGEIYNYKELRSELTSLGYSFRTSTDTEVILAAFSEWHVNSFDRLDGMFAFAIHDNRHNEVFLARDPAGIKPLYYHSHGSSLVFASEVRAFSSVNPAWPEEKHWPARFLAFGHIPEPYTNLQDVLSLPKGSFLRFDLNNADCSVSSFCHFSFSAGISNREQLLRQVAHELEAAVEKQMIADAPLGVFLSGGIDSSILATIAAKKSAAPIGTFSLYYHEAGFSEKYFQDLLIQKISVLPHSHLLGKEEFNNSLQSVLEAMDMPSCDGINTWFISKYARQSGLKAVLSGIGADELFGGYPSFRRMRKARLLAKLPGPLLYSLRHGRGKAMKRASYLRLNGTTGMYLFLRGYLAVHEIADQLDASEKEIWHVLEDTGDDNDVLSLDSQNQASWLEFNMYMQNQLLRDADVMSMAHGLEIRVPFLSKSLVRLLMDADVQCKFAGTAPKQLLIDAVGNQLPEEIWNRPKMGFAFPFAEWFAAGEWVKDLMMSGGRKTADSYEKFLAGRLHWSHLLSIMQLRRFGKA